MSETPSVAQIQARLSDVARLLRHGTEVDGGAREALAELVEELNTMLRSGQVPAAEVAHLAETTATLAESLHQKHDSSVLESVRDRFEQAALSAEARVPFLAGLVRRLSDALANMGILSQESGVRSQNAEKPGNSDS